MNGKEVILNLWYLRDEEGFIYSLRVKAYIGEGTEEEKLAFLKQRAILDYLIAAPFKIPKQFHIMFGTSDDAKVMPVTHVSMLEFFSSPIALFENAIKTIEKRMPAQSMIEIPPNPIVCITPLMQNIHGVIEPKIDVQVKYSEMRK